jgi:hypothetical protein
VARLTRRDVFTKMMGGEFKAAPCQPSHTCRCGCSKPRTPDPDVLKAVKRFQAWSECMREPHGALAWNVAQYAARLLSSGAVQEGPAVKFFGPDGRRAGYWRPGSDEIHISRGLSVERLINVVGHETAHWWNMADPSEESARFYAEMVSRRYLDQLAA